VRLSGDSHSCQFNSTRKKKNARARSQKKSPKKQSVCGFCFSAGSRVAQWRVLCAPVLQDRRRILGLLRRDSPWWNCAGGVEFVLVDFFRHPVDREVDGFVGFFFFGWQRGENRRAPYGTVCVFGEFDRKKVFVVFVR
jgi:hypothetical protein